MPEETPQVQTSQPPNQAKAAADSKKFILIAGIIIILLILGFIFYTSFNKSPASKEKTTTSTSTSSATASTPTTPTDETANWKTYASTPAKFTVKYPSDWVYTDYTSNNLCSENGVFFAPNAGLLGKCASGFGGLISVSQTQPPDTLDTVASQYSATDYTDFKKENTTVGGKTAVRISGISQMASEIADTTGTRIIIYIIGLSDRALILSYNQSKTWADYSAAFEQMVKSLKFL